MTISVDYAKLNELSAKLRRLESDLSVLTVEATRLSISYAQTSKYSNRDSYAIKRACDNVISSANKADKKMNVISYKLNRHSSFLKSAIYEYQRNDRIDKVSTLSEVRKISVGAFSGVGIVKNVIELKGSRYAATSKNGTRLVKLVFGNNRFLILNMQYLKRRLESCR